MLLLLMHYLRHTHAQPYTAAARRRHFRDAYLAPKKIVRNLLCIRSSSVVATSELVHRNTERVYVFVLLFATPWYSALSTLLL